MKLSLPVPTYCDLEDEEGEEGDGGGVGGEAGDGERDGHRQETPPDDQEVRESSLVEPGGHLTWRGGAIRWCHVRPSRPGPLAVFS